MKKVLCHGVFDVLHEGHLKYFESAKKHGDYLIVSVTDSKYVNKGPGRPYFNTETRINMLKSLKIIDEVVVSHSERATEVIKRIKPDFYVKGPDYKNKQDDITGGIYEEEHAICSIGGKLITTNDNTYSSSTLINKFFNQFDEQQNQQIEFINSIGGFEKIKKVIDELSKLNVLVLGEPIIDTYVFCRPQGISSKSPSISALRSKEENYAGGSLAIANHIANFVNQVNVIAPRGDDDYYYDRMSQSKNNILFIHSLYKNQKTPRKTRYIEETSNQRIFEITDITNDIWKKNDPEDLIKTVIRQSQLNHLTVLCDFGHGLFENGFLAGMKYLDNFVALNCQTNSSNFGFNPFTKHIYFDYLSLDLQEARIAYHDRHSSCFELFEKIVKDNNDEGTIISMTRGKDGAVLNYGGFTFGCPAFSDKVVDAVGAGDAYYAITSLLAYSKCNPGLIPFIGNVFAGLKTKIIGNKNSVTKNQLLKACEAILK